MALESFSLAELAYMEMFLQQIENTSFSLDEGAMSFCIPQIRILQNVGPFLGVENQLVADIVIRWKCIYSEFYAILIRLGAGKNYRKTFLALQQIKMNSNKHGEASLISLSEEHHQVARKILKEKGKNVLVCLLKQSYEQVQKILKPDQIVLEYCIQERDAPHLGKEDVRSDSYLSGYIVVVTPKAATLIKQIDFTKVLNLARKWSELLAAKCIQQDETTLAAKELCKLLFPNEVQTIINDPAVKRVFICPEGSLAVLPLELLPFDDGQLMMDKCSIIYLSSARELLRRLVISAITLVEATVEIQEKNDMSHHRSTSASGKSCGVNYYTQETTPLTIFEQTHPTQEIKDMSISKVKHLACRKYDEPTYLKEEPCQRQCIIFADPNYDLEISTSESESSLWESLLSPFMSLFKSETSTEDQIPVVRLEASKKEAREICQILGTMRKNIQVHCKLGDEATLSSALDVKSPFILHFSTHGFSHPEARLYRSSFWDDTKSGLLLAGSNTFTIGRFKRVTKEAGSGMLTALAVCGIDLEGTYLVYLSACVTSYGLYSIGESINSLAQAFRSAGACTVIATLWEVEDESASKFAAYFYQAACNREVPPSQALAYAKKKLKQEVDWAFWSSFVCIGEDLPLFPGDN